MCVCAPKRLKVICIQDRSHVFPTKIIHTYTHTGAHLTVTVYQLIDRPLKRIEWEQMGSLGIASYRILALLGCSQYRFFGDAAEADAATVHKHKQVATFICIDNVFILNFKAFDARRHSAALLPLPSPHLTHSLPHILTHSSLRWQSENWYSI